MKYTIYHADSGQITSVLTTADPVQAELNLANQSYLTGEYSDQYYVHNGQAILKPARPTSPGTYLFDYTTKTWQADLEQNAKTIRHQRNSELSTVDQINPIWYAALTQDQQTQLQQYRQALLDVPQQTSFPESVEWPAKPTWL